ncbi:MAG: hypothetical protein QOE70_5012 [Chthoniobacter sp.]|jgi:hypothetical protein|nr:hypothetical protein [Chthoniobacter sp.]
MGRGLVTLDGGNATTLQGPKSLWEKRAPDQNRLSRRLSCRRTVAVALALPLAEDLSRSGRLLGFPQRLASRQQKHRWRRPSNAPAPGPAPQRARLSVRDYYRIGEAGVLGRGTRRLNGAPSRNSPARNRAASFSAGSRENSNAPEMQPSFRQPHPVLHQTPSEISLIGMLSESAESLGGPKLCGACRV